jgi:hypothetical protein
MATRKEGFWVRVQNDAVTDCWDYAPSEEQLANQAGWREAVEVVPDVTPRREYITTHTFDITKTPVEIVWSKASLTIEDRRGGLIGNAKFDLRKIIEEQTRLQMSDNPAEEFDTQVVIDAKAAFNTRVAALNAAVTHEDLDALVV